MVYGRVIGNELRDVPPEFLPIWGQRWSGYRVPHGPSPFSIRVFSVDRMSELGPVLTSPTQFEMTLTEEDEGEDSSPESSQFRSCFLSSSIPIQTEATGLAFRPETPMPRSVPGHCSLNRPDDSPKMLHQRTERLPPQISTPFRATLPPRQRSIPIQAGDGSFDNDYTLWDMDCASTSIQLQTGHSVPNQIPSGQLQYTAPLHSIHTQSLAYPFRLDPSPQLGSDCLFLPCQGDDRTGFIPATSPSSSDYFTAPQIVADDPLQNQESRITTIPGVADPRYSMMPLWPQGLALPNRSLPAFLQNSESLPGPGMFYHVVSDHDEKSIQPGDVLGTFAHSEGCTPLSLDKPGYLDPGSSQFAR